MAARKRWVTCSMPSLPGLFSFFPLSPFVTLHMVKQTHLQVAQPSLCLSPSLCVCLGTSIHASIHTSILPQCLLLLLLLLLPDIFRDELLQQGKNRGRAVWATCVPLPSSSLSSGPLHLSLFFFFYVYLIDCESAASHFSFFTAL